MSYKKEFDEVCRLYKKELRKMQGKELSLFFFKKGWEWRARDERHTNCDPDDYGIDSSGRY